MKKKSTLIPSLFLACYLSIHPFLGAMDCDSCETSDRFLTPACCQDGSEDENVEEVCAVECPQGQLDFEIHLDPRVYQDSNWDEVLPGTDCDWARQWGLIGIWFPEDPPLFRPFLADPRQVTYSAGWRFDDQVLVKNVIDVSFGDIFPIYRWCDIWCFRGDLEVGIEGGVWAVFDPLHDSAPLINADYYVGIPITYAWDDWAIRLRGYHISCHIGDEFLLEHPHFHRRNPSTEFFDLYVSYQFTREIRLYGGVGWLSCQDDSFRIGPWYAECGLELRMPQLGYIDYCNRLYGEPFFAMDFRYNNTFKHHIDSTYVLGYEWGKLSGLRHKFRVYIEYHDGYSAEGQFCKFATNYFSIRGSYGY